MTEPSGSAPPTESTHCYIHRERATNIHCIRCDRPICPDCMTSASVGFQCPSCVSEGRRGTRQPTGTFGGRVGSGSPVTLTLIAVNVACFLATVNGSSLVSGGSETDRFYRFALYGYGLSENHEWYRLLTSTFLHLGLIHIASNMFVLYLVGPQLERVLGWWRFLATYVIAGLGGSVVTYVFVDPREVTVGASGAIFGLFAAFVVIGRKLSADLSGIVGTIVINLIITFAIPGISITGHLGGLAVGALAGAVITGFPRRPGRQLAGLAGLVVLLVVAVALRTAALS